MARRIGLIVSAALVFTASAAFAQETTPAADVGTPGGNGFGLKGQIVISDVPPVSIPIFSGVGASFGSAGSPAGSIGYVSSGGNGEFILGIAPALDYFAIDHISVGGGVGLTFATGNGSSITALSLVPRAGYQIPATPKVSVWPRLGLDLSVVSAGGSTDTNFGITIDAPILFHATDHFFLGGAPTLNVGLTGDNKVTSFTLDFILGGWM